MKSPQLTSWPPRSTPEVYPPAPLTPAIGCPRITAEFLDHERLLLGDEMFRQEYLCEFVTPGGAFIPLHILEAAIDPSIPPLFPGPLFSGPSWSKT